MSPLTIRPVLTAADRLAFIKLPWRLYANDPAWVPPLIGEQKKALDPARGSFFEHGAARLFLALRDGAPCGRISAHVNFRHDEIFRDRKAFFGFFECEDQQETADLLLAAAEAYAHEQGRTTIEGPLSFGIYDEIGILTEGFNAMPYVLNAHNPPYYPRLLERAGYSKSVDWYAFRSTVATARRGIDPQLFTLRDRILAKAALTLRPIDLGRRFREDAAAIQRIFSTAWGRNWGHVPLTPREFNDITGLLKKIVVPELSFMAEYRGRPAGFALSIYDANPAVKRLNGRLFPFGWITFFRNVRAARRFRLILLGVEEPYRRRGIDAAFYLTVAERAGALGFAEAEMSNIVETNRPMLEVIERLPVERYKTYRIYRKSLSQ